MCNTVTSYNHNAAHMQISKPQKHIWQSALFPIDVALIVKATISVIRTR